MPTAKNSAKSEAKTTPSNPDDWVGQECPLCHKGRIIKGHTAYGCSEWKNGCTYRKPF